MSVSGLFPLCLPIPSAFALLEVFFLRSSSVFQRFARKRAARFRPRPFLLEVAKIQRASSAVPNELPPYSDISDISDSRM